MKISIVTPAPARSRKGNRVTAVRWARILRELGHRARIHQAYSGEDCDALIALHAKHSARSVQEFYDSQPNSPLILALTGTDLYRDIKTSASARTSLQLADRLVLLQPHGIERLADEHQAKARVIYQSVPCRHLKVKPLTRVFEIVVIGHLRSVKDPFRAAISARQLPSSSRIQITHLGAALDPAMKRRAVREMEINRRYRWIGEQPRWKTLQYLARSRALVLSSKMEGGANVISEAIVNSVPVLSSRISGSVGLLNEDYGGYFEVGDSVRLTELLTRVETDATFYGKLKAACNRRRPLFDPVAERRTWKKLLGEFV